MGSMVDAMKSMFAAKKRRQDDDELGPNELSSAGVEIKRGDSRLKKGLRRSNLTAQERAKLDKYRGS